MSANTKNTTRKVATAALAGLMAVGTLPAAAIAEDTSSVETQSVSETEDFEDSATKVTKATIDGTEADSSSAVATGEAQTFVPTEITTASGQVITLTKGDNNTYTGSDGWTYTIEGNTANTVGDHTATVTGTKGSEKKTHKFTWTLTSSALAGVVAYSGDDQSNTTFTYNGEAQTANFAINGTTLTSDDIDVSYVPAGGQDSDAKSNFTDAGSYVAILTGKGKYAGSTARVNITVNKLTLSSSNVHIADTTSASAPTASDVTVDGIDDPSALGLSVAFKSGTTADGSTSTYGQNGSYTYTVTSSNGNVTGSADVTFNKVGSILDSSHVQWNNGTNGTLTVDLDNPTYFDASKVKVTDASGKTLSSDEYTLVYEKEENGTWVSASASDLNTAGTYRVSVKINSAASDYAVGGIDGYLTVNVAHTAKASAYVTYNGTLVGTNGNQGKIKTTYDGNDVAAATTIQVRDSNGKTLTKGTDYDVTYLKGDDEVSSITDAGEYTIKITLKNGYTFANGGTVDTTAVEVSALSVTPQLSTAGQLHYGSTYFYNYTGKEITPTIEFYTTGSDGKQTKVDVPTSAYTVTYSKDGKTVSSVVDEGDYTLAVTDAHNTADDSDNYEVASLSNASFSVSSKRRFDDVANDAWYAQVIMDASDAKYMNGYSGTNFFGPEDTFTRGQAACVLYNIAKGSNSSTTSSSDSASSTFSDVTDQSAYYYTAVTWAAHTGVVNGYGDGTFKPDQPVTREEFAAMLANYAKQVGTYTAGDDSVIAKYGDASSVDSWAKDSVVWAVANKIMGNSTALNPTGNITRAETAAMTMNFVNNVK